MLFVSSYFGWVVLMACLVPSLSHTSSVLQEALSVYGATDECREELLKCAVPVLIDYLFVTDFEQLLRRVREVELYRHCGQLQKSRNCFRDLIGEDQCSNLSAEAVVGWKTTVDPMATDVLKYLCRKEYKNFKANYRCLLTEEVYTAIINSNCSRISLGPDVMKAASLVGDCVSSVIEPICGAKAGDVVKGLIRTIAKRVVSIMESRPNPGGPNEVTPGEYTGQLDILKKILWRK